ncbi:MAG TPA: class I SAM-dependent methyltransferase [Gaiellaceae bacterium]|jgi:SAM-dependent methyltransferase|nr:class I SAM-dependent methyltransferase [Gaiellaceae bacterium]
MTHPERIVPDETSAGILALHLKRYEFARSYADGRNVLDAACGVGYGTAFLAGTAATVIGVDLDEETIGYARDRYAAENVEFETMDVTSLRFDDATFDVIVSFETIEHVPDAGSAIREAARVLKPDGVYIASTPRVEQTSHTPDNPFHATEYSADDFRSLLAESFDDVVLYGQRRVETRRHRFLRRVDVFGLRRRLDVSKAGGLLGSAPTTEVTLDDVVIERDRLDQATEVVAVCRGRR